MYNISIYYQKKLIKNPDNFSKVCNSLRLLYPNKINFITSSKIKFQINFNDKLIYSLDDNFDSNAVIDDNVLSKSKKYIANAIDINQSKNISRVDDIGIDDF